MGNLICTKTFWTGIAAVIVGISTVTVGYLMIIHGSVDSGIQTITTGALGVVGGLGLIFARDAISKVSDQISSQTPANTENKQ
jgi:hypothetical protein